MTVICPKCGVRLKIPEEKLSAGGSRFRCPKCKTVLLVRKPTKTVKPINKELVLIAHADDNVVQRCKQIIHDMGLKTVVAKDGIEAMVIAMKEHPFVALIDVALPKIYGFEVSRRIKHRKEISDIKVILITSVYDKDRYRREPSSLYGADDYIEEPELESQLKEKILSETVKTESPAEQTETEEPSAPEPSAEPPQEDETVERARRLVRTILSDLMLYHPDKVKESIKNGTFREDFASQLAEGLKLYNMRIPEDVRQKGDFYNEEIDRFINQIKERYNL